MKPLPAKILHPQVILPAKDIAVDWGAKRLLLIRKGTARLWWRLGHNTWAGNYSPREYEPAELCFYNGKGLGEVLHTGGRLSHKLIRSLRARIDELFPGLYFNPEQAAEPFAASLLCPAGPTFTLELTQGTPCSICHSDDRVKPVNPRLPNTKGRRASRTGGVVVVVQRSFSTEVQHWCHRCRLRDTAAFRLVRKAKLPTEELE